MHVCIYGVYYKHIYPACSLSHNDRKLFCLLSHAAASGPKWELLWIVGTLLVRSVCIFDWSLYTCAHKEWEYQNVNAANHKNTKYTLNIFIQKTEKQKSDKRKEKRRHWHRSSFGGFWRSAFFLSLPHPFSLSLCVCVCLSATSTNVDNQIKDFRNRAENRNRSRNGDCTEVPWNHHNFQP